MSLYRLPCVPPSDGDPTGLPNTHPRRNRAGELIQKRFHLRERLGVGGCGDAYLAWDEELERKCVLKFCTDGQMSSAEARALAKVNHRNVVSLHNRICVRENAVTTSVLVLEFIDGGDLCVYAARRGLDTRTKVGLFLSACSGVQALHNCGFIHCDLKPGNFVVDRASGEAKLIDLGLARPLSAPDDARPEFFGTPGYSPPEQYERHTRLGYSADVYSLGITLYELVTGVRPYPTPAAGVLHHRAAVEQAATAAVDVNLADSTLSEKLNKLIRATLAKVPLQRPALHDVISELGSILATPSTRGD